MEFLRLSIALYLPLLCLAASLQAQESTQRSTFEAEIKIPMRDGVRLAANTFRPKGDGPWPAILSRTPYGKQDKKWPGGKDYASKGYVIVVQDCRGRETYEGVWEPFLNRAASKKQIPINSCAPPAGAKSSSAI